VAAFWRKMGKSQERLLIKMSRNVMIEPEAFMDTETGGGASAQRESTTHHGMPTHFRVYLEKTPTSCERCTSYNGKVVPINEYQQGKTAPPFHPNCRCWAEICDAYGNVLATRESQSLEWTAAGAQGTLRSPHLALAERWGNAALTQEPVAARDFLESAGANVRWLANRERNGNTYARAAVSFNGHMEMIEGRLVNGRLMYCPKKLHGFFERAMLTDYDRAAGITLRRNEDSGRFHKDVTVPLDKALNRAAREAELRQLVPYKARFPLFYRQVNHRMPWDIKVPERWNETIAPYTFPGRFDTLIYFRGVITTPENLGNFAYGYIGAALGLTLPVLVLGSFYAAGMPLPTIELTFNEIMQIYEDTLNADFANEIGDWYHIIRGFLAYRN